MLVDGPGKLMELSLEVQREAMPVLEMQLGVSEVVRAESSSVAAGLSVQELEELWQRKLSEIGAEVDARGVDSKAD
jgi:hypothetical protein